MKREVGITLGTLAAIGAGYAAQYTVEKLLTPKVHEIVVNDPNMTVPKAAILGVGNGVISGSVGLLVTSNLLNVMMQIYGVKG